MNPIEICFAHFSVSKRSKHAPRMCLVVVVTPVCDVNDQVLTMVFKQHDSLPTNSTVFVSGQDNNGTKIDINFTLQMIAAPEG